MSESRESKPDKTETPVTIESVKKTIAPLLTYSAILGALLHYFGYTYLKAFLEGAGFYRPHVDISIQEALYQGSEAFTYFLATIIEKTDPIKFAQALMPGFLFSAAIITAMYLAKIKISRKHFQEKSLAIKHKIKTYFITPDKHIGHTLAKPLAIFSTSFVSLYGFFALIALATLILSITFWVIINLGQTLGFSAGKNKISDHACKQLKLEDIPKSETRKLGCQTLTLSKEFNGKTELKGIRIFTSKDTIFFLTRDGSYEVNNQLEVKLFTNMQDIEKLREEANKKNQRPSNQ